MQEKVQTKHAHILTVDTCKCIAGLIIGAILGHSKEKILSHRYCPVSCCGDADELAPKIDEIARGSFKHINPHEIVGSGYVIKSLKSAL